jgi:hypothetical protein
MFYIQIQLAPYREYDMLSIGKIDRSILRREIVVACCNKQPHCVGECRDFSVKHGITYTNQYTLNI